MATIYGRGFHLLFFLPTLMMANIVLLVAGMGFDAASYSRTASLAEDNTLDIHWTVDSKRGTLRLAVHAKAVTGGGGGDGGGGGGWVGFGFAEMGGMEGSDMFFYEAEVRKFGNSIVFLWCYVALRT